MLPNRLLSFEWLWAVEEALDKPTTKPLLRMMFSLVKQEAVSSSSEQGVLSELDLSKRMAIIQWKTAPHL